MEGMKEIGLMESTMAMELRVGREEVGIEVNIGKECGMDSVCILSLLAIRMLVNGLMAKAVVLDSRAVLMVVTMLDNSNVVLSMELVAIISGIHFVFTLFISSLARLS